MTRILRLTAILLLAIGCRQQVVHDSDAGLGWAGPALTLNGQKFTGILIRGNEQSYTKSEYRDGMKEGTEEIVQSGIVIARGEFSDGRKDGLHLGWFMDGSRRFRYNYKHGLLDGEFWEWHPNGNLATFGRIHNGELIGKKKWRPDGQIYTNYVMVGNRQVGLPGAKLCFQVRAEDRSSDDNQQSVDSGQGRTAVDLKVVSP